MFTKEIEIPEIFYKEYLTSQIKDCYYPIILLQNILYQKISDDEMRLINENINIIMNGVANKPSNLSKIFPEKMGQLLGILMNKKDTINCLDFLKEIGIVLKPANIELSFF